MNTASIIKRPFIRLAIKESVFRNYVKLAVYVVIALLLLLLTTDPMLDIFAMVILAIGAASIVEFDIFHPFCWYSVFFMLYSIGYSVNFLYSRGFVGSYSDDLMLLQCLGLSTFLIVVSPDKVQLNSDRLRPRSVFITKGFFYGTLLTCFITILSISGGSHTKKSELFSSGSLLVQVGFRAALVLLILYTILQVNNFLINNKLNKKLIFFTGTTMFLLFYFSGERDLVLRFVLVTFLLYIGLKSNRKNNFVLILLGAALVFIVPLMGQFKYFGLTGEIYSTSGNPIMNLLNSEFTSASRNLQTILEVDGLSGFFNGYTLYIDFVRGFIELPFMPKFVSFGTVAWFNSTFYPGRGTGMGFTIIGEGYINFGYFGVVILSAIVGGLAKLLYRNSNKGLYGFVIYILSVPIFIYSTRADLANILSPLIGQIIASIIIVIVVERILRRVVMKE